MYRRQTAKKLGNSNSFGFETLEDRTMFAATPLSAAAVTPDAAVVQTAAAVLSTVEWVQSLHFTQFGLLAPDQVQYLTLQQVASITHEEYLLRMSEPARAALSLPQIRALNTSLVRIYPLTTQQIGWLTAPQIQQLGWEDFHLLSPAQVPVLTPAQISTIPRAEFFSWWSDAAQASLTPPQVQALNVQTIFLYELTPQQHSWLTIPQLRSLHFHDFRFLNAQQIPYLTRAQVATISHAHYLNLISADARAALTPAQVQSLNTAVVQIYPLTPQQAGWLTTSQIQKLGWEDFHLIHSTRTVVLAPAQIATIPGSVQFASWSTAARAALRLPQVQALDFPEVSLYLLTPQQVSWLTVPQIQSIHFHDFRFLSAEQIPYLTPAQVASISHAHYLSLIPAHARAALTQVQVQALNTAAVQIHPLTAQQVSWLTPAQIQQVTSPDLRFLTPPQIPYLTTAQLAGVTEPLDLLALSDESQAALSRAQLMALAPATYEGFTRSHLAAPSDYHPAVHNVMGPDGFPINAHMGPEAQRVFDLVPHAAATHVAVGSGLWSAPGTWTNGLIPSAGAKVLIPLGVTVDFDAVMNSAVKTLRIDGLLRFVADRNTQLKADTIVVDTRGLLFIGTPDNPIQNHVTARIVIANGGPIDTTWDPNLLSRGIISRGTVRMHGAYVTPYAALTGNASVGDTTLTLASVPANWKVGDELAIAGVNPNVPDFGTDRVRIRAITGQTVVVDPLRYSHHRPEGFGLSIQVANLTRNVALTAEFPQSATVRPHLMFMHNPNVNIANIGVYGFGRTDKSVPINDPKVVNGVLLPGTGLNPRARYAVHFHHTGVDPNYAPAVIRGSVVDGSSGWGFVNHSSNVTMQDNVAIDVYGSSFVTEDGNEIGLMQRNLSLSVGGSGDVMMSRVALHDFGFRGHGFWLQGPGVQLVDNIAAGSLDSAYFFLTASAKNMFDAVNLDNPAHAAGRLAIPVSAAPLAGFDGNEAYGSKIGLEIWDHLAAMEDAESYINGFTAWNIRYAGIDIHYSSNITISDATLLAFGEFAADSYGINTNWAVQDINFQNVRTEKFEVGIDLPLRGTNEVTGGHFSALLGLLIEKGQTATRSVTIAGAITFARPSAAQIAGRPCYEIYLSGALNFDSYPSGAPEVFEEDKIYLAANGQTPVRLYYVQQLPGFIPFPAAIASGYLPAEYLNKTNLQLWSEFGLAFNSKMFPAGVRALPGQFAFPGPLA